MGFGRKYRRNLTNHVSVTKKKKIEKMNLILQQMIKEQKEKQNSSANLASDQTTEVKNKESLKTLNTVNNNSTVDVKDIEMPKI